MQINISGLSTNTLITLYLKEVVDEFSIDIPTKDTYSINICNIPEGYKCTLSNKGEGGFFCL